MFYSVSRVGICTSPFGSTPETSKLMRNESGELDKHCLKSEICVYFQPEKTTTNDCKDNQWFQNVFDRDAKRTSS